MPVDVKMPQLGESVVEGTVSRWLKQPGETIKLHEPLLEVTTDKVDTEVPSSIEGTVVELLVPEGETVRVGTVIARLMGNGEDARRPADPPASAAPSPVTSPSAPAKAPPISPVVARLAAEHRLDLSAIVGSGGNGRITKKDVEQYLEQAKSDGASRGPGAQRGGQETLPPPAQSVSSGDQALQEMMLSGPAANAQQDRLDTSSMDQDEPNQAGMNTEDARLQPGDELVPLTPMRRAIAEHMTRSKRDAPHVTTVMEIDVSRVAAHRAHAQADYERQGARLTYTAYFVHAAVAALHEVPVVNSSFRPDGIQMHARINVGIAVAIPDGLIVPVIKDADERSLLGLARAVNDLSARARGRQLRAEDVEGGAFTITNHGVGGSIFAIPIINQPQAAILGVGAIEKRPVVVSEGGLDAIAIRLRCYVSLTFDHRIIDGATGDRFLQIVKQTLEGYA